MGREGEKKRKKRERGEARKSHHRSCKIKKVNGTEWLFKYYLRICSRARKNFGDKTIT